MEHLANIVSDTLVPHSAYAHAEKKLNQYLRRVIGSAEPVGCAVLGESRTGKSRVIEELCLANPGTRTAEGLNSPILNIKTPPKPTIKGVAERLLDALGDPKPTKGTENELTRRLLRLMDRSGTRMVILDEFQHFYDKSSNKLHYHVCDWLKILMDEAKAAVVVAGLPECRAIIRSNEQLAGRFYAPIEMPRFDWTRDEHRDEFIGILFAFEESLGKHFELPNISNENMAFRFYCATGGLMGLLHNILKAATWNAIEVDSNVIDFRGLHEAHIEAVIKVDGQTGFPSPFTRDFVAEPNERLLAAVARVGTRSEEPEVPAVRRRRRVVANNIAEAQAVTGA